MTSRSRPSVAIAGIIVALVVTARAVPHAQIRYDIVDPVHLAKVSKTPCALDKTLKTLDPQVVASPQGTWSAKTEYYVDPAQTGPASPRQPDAVVIEAAKKAIAQDIDPKLPKTTFDAWLRGVVGVQPLMTWEVNDCGEQTGNPALDHGRDFPMCAEVHVVLGPNRDLRLSLAMGTFGKGLTKGKPALWMGSLQTPDGKSQEVRTLSDLPALLVKKEPSRFSVSARKKDAGREFEVRIDRALDRAHFLDARLAVEIAEQSLFQR
jgi:hypothetical protein